MKKTSIWDTEKLDKLKKLWEKGVPITKIGDELGVSRNAIAGKAHRLGLPKRNSPISSEGEERSTKTKIKSLNVLKEVPLKISLRNVEWSRTKCCWPEGDPKLKGFKFCGEEILPGRPYCTKHSYIAYTNSREN